MAFTGGLRSGPSDTNEYLRLRFQPLLSFRDHAFGKSQ